MAKSPATNQCDEGNEIDGATCDVASDAQEMMRNACKRFDEQLETLIKKLTLPLSESLGVPPEQVPAASQEILEAIIRLRQERDEVFRAADAAIEEHVGSFPEKDRQEVRETIKLTFKMGL